METKEFDIVFRGDIVLGHQLQDVKQRMQQLFKVDSAKVDALFTGRPVPLKRGLDQATAEKYRDVLLKAGAQVEVTPTGRVKPAPAPTSMSSATPPSREATPIKPTSWSLAPVGAYLLSPTERPPATPVFVDTGAISLRPSGGNLLDVSEQTSVKPVELFVPDFGVAEIGSDLVSADEKMDLPFVEIEIEDWGLAELGADLIAAEERAPVLDAVVSVSDFGLAPAGSDLGQLKLQVTPVTPDISKIRLAD